MPLPSGLGNCANDKFAISYKIPGSKEITFEKDKTLKYFVTKKGSICDKKENFKTKNKV